MTDERLVGDIGLGDDDAAGGVFVQAVDDAGALDTANARKFAAAVMEHRVDQRAIGVARRGVDDHARGFVDHHEIVIFKQNL